MEIFLAGGTGFVGGHVRRALLAKGHNIRLLVHKGSAEKEHGIEEFVGDATNVSTFLDVLRGCDAAINLIGIIREFPARGITFERLHVQATHNILTAATSAGVTRYLQMSALGTGPKSTSGYFKTKYQAEVEVRASGLDYTIFRPSIIFGPKDGFVTMMAKYMKMFPAMPVIGDGEYQMQPIAADDVARCFADALDMPETIEKTYELCGPDRMSYNQILDTIGRVIGMKHVLKIKNPVILMRLIVPFMEKFPSFPLTTDQMTMLLQGNVCDGTWRNTFKFAPINFEPGIRTYLKP
jgi:uncharacterized protein YbjT (DUF2867 family)